MYEECLTINILYDKLKIVQIINIERGGYMTESEIKELSCKLCYEILDTKWNTFEDEDLRQKIGRLKELLTDEQLDLYLDIEYERQGEEAELFEYLSFCMLKEGIRIGAAK